MPEPYPSELARKLNLRSGQRLRLLRRPDGLDLDDLPAVDSGDADGVLLFVRTLAELEAESDPLVAAAGEDRLAWVAYPKAGQLGTDLNRDVIWRYLVTRGVRGVRQVAIDEVWSAMRFRPGE